MNEEDRPPSRPAGACGCFATPHEYLVQEEYLGMDEDFAEVSLLVCSNCGQRWLRYLYELESVTASGRWFLAPITEEQSLALKQENAKAILGGLSWYYYGGRYFGGMSGVAAGSILLNP